MAGFENRDEQSGFAMKLWRGERMCLLGFDVDHPEDDFVGFAVEFRAPDMLITLVAAIRTEEASLDEKFSGEYSAYRAGTAAPIERRFSLSRAVANREYRSITGLAVGMIFLYLRAQGLVP